LAPAFDQLPMAYAPQSSGNMLEQPVKVARPSAETLDAWDEARSLARAYWRTAVDADLTDSMHAIAAEHARR
jgi:hypothetical protein